MFDDRDDAGRRLAQELQPFASQHPIVVALPRGGVPVGAHVAEALSAPLDVVIVRKLGAPDNPEFAFGAVGEDGVVVVDEPIRRELAISDRELADMVSQADHEVASRAVMFRGQRIWEPVEGRTVIVVDDGLATGATALAAVRVLRSRNPLRVVVAVPTGSRFAVDKLRGVADEVVCLDIPRYFGSVGAQYERFEQVEDDEVLALLRAHSQAGDPRAVKIPIGGTSALDAQLGLPDMPIGLVIFAHGSGSSRHSPRNIEIARHLQQQGMATLLMDLLTDAESISRANVFDVELLAHRLRCARDWVLRRKELAGVPIAYFGASTGAAAALAAADGDARISAVVSRGGRPDLAGDHLGGVLAPTLLIVGGADETVLQLNRWAMSRVTCESVLRIVPGATHLFEEPGAMRVVAELATQWFDTHFAQLAHSGPSVRRV